MSGLSTGLTIQAPVDMAPVQSILTEWDIHVVDSTLSTLGIVAMKLIGVPSITLLSRHRLKFQGS